MKSISPCSGLVGDGKIAFIRDSIYSAAALWTLSMAYKSVESDNGRQFELEQTAVKVMRGVLTSLMYQAKRIEDYKRDPCPAHAIRAYFDWNTGQEYQIPAEVVSYNSDHHLQLHVVALYLNYLAQMIKSRLNIILTSAEVSLVQNLVYYIERSYRTPDFGIWGRGSRHNNGTAELSASSVGAVKSALFAIDGINLFGPDCASWSTIYVDRDAFSRNRLTLEALLPGESTSKATDSALISVLSYPFFALALESPLYQETMERIRSDLERPCGFLRFNKDGFGTVLEDKSRIHYEPAELASFENIESEWPVFDAQMLIASHFSGEDIEYFRGRFQSHLDKYEFFYPTMYFVKKDDVDNVKAGKTVQKEAVLLPNHQWVQAVALVAMILDDGLVRASDLDPLHTFERVNDEFTQKSDNEIRISLISENNKLRTMLSTFAVESETPQQVEPIVVWPTQELQKAFAIVGEDTRLGLTGRPKRPIGVLGSSNVYRLMGRTIVTYPLVFDVSDFYISSDTETLIENVWYSLDHLRRNHEGKDPIFLFILREELFKDRSSLDSILEVLASFRRGHWRGIRVRVGRLNSFVVNSRQISISLVKSGVQENFLSLGSDGLFRNDETKTKITRSTSQASLYSSNSNNDKNFDEDLEELRIISELDSSDDLKALYSETDSLNSKIHILMKLTKLFGNLFVMPDNVTVHEKLNGILRIYTKRKDWSIVRLIAAHCGKIVDSLAPSVTAILCHQKHLSLGVFGKEDVIISSPLPPSEIQKILFTNVFPHCPQEAVLHQEILLNLGSRILVSKPELLDGIFFLRIGWIIKAMKLQLVSAGKNESDIFSLSPSEAMKLLEEVLSPVATSDSLHIRRLDGALQRAPTGFFARFWILLLRAPQIQLGQELIDSKTILHNLDPSDTAYHILVEEHLQNVRKPEKRSIMVETCMLIATLLERNPELEFTATCNIDEIISRAQKAFANDCPNEDFYAARPEETLKYLSHSITVLLLSGGEISLANTSDGMCRVQ